MLPTQLLEARRSLVADRNVPYAISGPYPNELSLEFTTDDGHMLEHLDEIDWAHIHHSHGTAEKFPEWLRALTRNDDAAWREYDEDGEEVDSALNDIREYSNHQGSIYEVTPYVTPFIIELLKGSDPKRAPTLLFMLGGYAHGETVFSAHAVMMRRVFEERGEDYDAKVRASQQWVNDTYECLEKNLPLFLPYLESPDAQARMATAALLSSFKDEPTVKEALTKQLALETNAKVLRQIKQALIGEQF